MARNRSSFFERLTGGTHVDVDNVDQALPQKRGKKILQASDGEVDEIEELAEEEEGQLTLDVFQTPEEIVVQSFIAGARLDDIDVSITQDMLTIRGRRQQSQETETDNYYYQELYWGSFSRSVLLPQEVDVDNAQATLKNGLLTIRLKKLDRERVQKLRVRHE
jgi:HSP20 family molecular chaperone IbpA